MNVIVAVYKVFVLQGIMVPAPRHTKRISRLRNSFWKLVPFEFPVLTCVVFALFCVLWVVGFRAERSALLWPQAVAPLLKRFSGTVKWVWWLIWGIRIIEASTIWNLSKKRRLSEEDQLMWTLQALFLGMPAYLAFRNATRVKIS